MTKRSILTLACSLLSLPYLNAQDRPIGYWRAHMPYNNAVSAATDGNTLFVGSDQSFYTYNVAQEETSTYSKVEGMADVGIAFIDYDATTGTTIIAYENCNIDLFRNETFYNIPDVKLRSFTGLKRINDIYTENGLCYLSTTFGVVVINLSRKEIKETYTFINNNQNIEIKGFTGTQTHFYTITSKGIYKANKNNPSLQAFSSWQQIHAGNTFRTLAAADNRILVHTKDSLFSLNNDTLAMVYKSPWEITAINPHGNVVRISEYKAASFNGVVKEMNLSLQVTDSFTTLGKPVQSLVLSDGSVWIADAFNGMLKKEGGNASLKVKPQGPASVGSFDILPHDGELYVAHGGYNDNWTYIYNNSGFSHFKDGKWTEYNRWTRQEMAAVDVTDVISIAKDPQDGTVYAGSYRSGLIILKTDGSIEIKKGPVLEPTNGDITSYRVGGVTFDKNGHLWLTMAGATNEIVVKTKDGAYYKYAGGASNAYAAYPVVDDNNQKWYIVPGGGLAVYNDNHTPENRNDDSYRRVQTSTVSNVVNSLIIDKEGALWFGTNDGIGIINCPGSWIQGSCQIERPIVQYDQFPGYLFQNENVKALAVDGANRKWVGTTNGVWLISPDGDRIIYRFTAENSPLPSNVIQRIAVDPVTGDVYIGTSEGLVSYRSTATEGGEGTAEVVTFPNPVPSGYSGTIAIKGLVRDADVRITDISGQLIYRTQALGGQAVWNGLDYTGKRPQSGVYLIFVSNRDGSQTYAGKMVFME